MQDSDTIVVEYYASVERKSKKNDRVRKEAQRKRKQMASSSSNTTAKRAKTGSSNILAGVMFDDDAVELLAAAAAASDAQEQAERQGLVHVLHLAWRHPREPFRTRFEYEWLCNGSVLVMDADSAEEAQAGLALFKTAAM